LRADRALARFLVDGMSISVPMLQLLVCFAAFIGVLVAKVAVGETWVGTLLGFVSIMLVVVGLQCAQRWHRTIRVPARRLARGKCVWCGYQLEGVRDARCPECGERTEGG
jgi:hypothetical protein